MASGRLIRAFAKIEKAYADLIADILKLKDWQATAVFSVLRYEQRQRLLLSAIDLLELPDQTRKSALKTIDAIADHYTLRNSIAHDAWGRGDEQNAAGPFVARAGRKGIKMQSPVGPNGRAYTASEILCTADEVDMLREQLLGILIKRDLPGEDPSKQVGD